MCCRCTAAALLCSDTCGRMQEAEELMVQQNNEVNQNQKASVS
jgi:hypothetical protein